MRQSAFSVRFTPPKTQVFQGFPLFFLEATGLSGFGSYATRITFLERTKEDVIAFLKDRQQYPEAYKAPPGWYSGGYDPRSHHDIPPIVVKDLHVYYEELLARQPDVMTAKDVEALTGYAVSSVNNWIRRGYLKAFRKGSIYLIPKLYLVEFFCSVPFRTITRKTPWHVQTLKNFPDWDQCRALLKNEGGAE